MTTFISYGLLSTYHTFPFSGHKPGLVSCPMTIA
jgi:hypothetical protein